MAEAINRGEGGKGIYSKNRNSTGCRHGEALGITIQAASS